MEKDSKAKAGIWPFFIEKTPLTPPPIGEMNY